jgi:hypothetical protein
VSDVRVFPYVTAGKRATAGGTLRALLPSMRRTALGFVAFSFALIAAVSLHASPAHAEHADEQAASERTRVRALELSFAGGARYCFAPNAALLVRIDYPALSLGVSFLL